MKLSKYLKYPALLSLLLPLSGCIQDDMPTCPEEMKRVPVRFTITLSNHTQGTRTDGEDDTATKDVNAPYEGDDDKWSNIPEAEDGYAFDNKIDNAQVYIYSVAPGGTLATDYLIGSMTASTIVPRGTGRLAEDGVTLIYDQYDIQGNFETTYPVQLLETGDFRMVVVANTGSDDLSDLGAATFTRHGIPSTNQRERINSSSFSSIPMYGVGEVSFQGLSSTQADANGNYVFNLKNKSGAEVSVPMLRSMAKIRVKVNQKMQDERKVKLKSLKFSRHSEKGHFVPNKWNSISSVNELKLSESLNVVIGDEDSHYEKNCEADTEGSGNGETMIRFYVPDTFNIDNPNQFHDHTEEGEITLTVTYVSDDDPTEKYGIIYFRPYDTETGQPLRTEGTLAWDIIRNHIYEFVIEGVEDSYSLNLQVSVKDWTYNSIKTEF